MTQVACPACNTGNRVGAGDPNAAKCGRCGEKLFTGAPIDVDDSAFAAHLKLSSIPVIVDVWAQWCGPCRMMAPTFAAAAEQFGSRVRFLKLNADQTSTPGQLGVRGIPALILFHNGREIARQAGLMIGAQLDAWLRQAIQTLSIAENHR